MKETEKNSLLDKLKAELTDWNTSWNNGRNEGLQSAIKIVKDWPVDPEEETEEHF